MTEPGERHGLHPGATSQHLDVDEGARGQPQAEGIPGELDRLAQSASDDREGPAKRPQRVVGLGEQQARHAFTGRWNLAPQEIGEQPPRLVAAQRLQADAAPLDPGPSQEVDAQSHVVSLAVTRAVTRLTVTLSLDQFNGRKGNDTDTWDRPTRRRTSGGLDDARPARRREQHA